MHICISSENKPKMAYSRNLPKMAVMDDHGLSWTIMDWHGLAWTGMDWHGLAWAGMNWIGLDWTRDSSLQRGQTIMISQLQTYKQKDGHC